MTKILQRDARIIPTPVEKKSTNVNSEDDIEELGDMLEHLAISAGLALKGTKNKTRMVQSFKAKIDEIVSA